MQAASQCYSCTHTTNCGHAVEDRQCVHALQAEVFEAVGNVSTENVCVVFLTTHMNIFVAFTIA